jgi:hypothetical protein
MTVSPTHLAPSYPYGESPGYIQKAVQRFVQKIWQQIRPYFVWLGWIKELPSKNEEPPISPVCTPPEPVVSPREFEKDLLRQLELETMPPDLLFRQFKRYTPSLKVQQKIFEKIGRKLPLSRTDRAISWIYSNTRMIQRYRTMGENLAKNDPYLLAPFLRQALQKVITPTD